jgi:hypothetical protein
MCITVCLEDQCLHSGCVRQYDVMRGIQDLHVQLTAIQVIKKIHNDMLRYRYNTACQC